MVILQFNKLIRNKWVWGAFAVVISAAFCFDDLFTSRDRQERSQGSAGLLGGESVDLSEFNTVADDIRGLGKNRDWKRPASEVNRSAWETIAALRVARANGVETTPEEIRQAIRGERGFAPNGAFNLQVYKYILRENGMTPEQYEDFVKRQRTVARVAGNVLEAAAWVSPMEIDRGTADLTDVFTVKVAKFKQSKAEADAVKLDDAGLRKWYDANTNSIALPERVKIRFLRYSAGPEVLAKMSVSDDEMHDYYDSNTAKWTSTDTNGVEQVRKFDEVKGEIEKDLRKLAALEYFETNLTARVYGGKSAKGVSRLDQIAREDGLKVAVSDYFTLDGSYVEGFMKRPAVLFPGADGIVDMVAQIDAESEDFRYGVVAGKDAVWLVERAEVSKAHVPTFEEAKSVIRPRALEAARAEAFKARVEAIAAKGVAEVEKTPGISTNCTFSVGDMAPNAFPDQYAVAGAVRKLAKGGLSEFVPTGKGSAILVICVDRVAGDAAKAALMRGQIRDQLAMVQRRQLPSEWLKWNLERLGFEPNSNASVTPEDLTEEE